MAQKKDEDKKEVEGEVFYEAVPGVAVNPEPLVLSKLSEGTLEVLESAVIFIGGTVVVLILLRIILMIMNVSGGNLLTYLLYAVSYPFLMAINTGQSQVPNMANKDLYENIALLLIYSVVFYGFFRFINAFKNNKNNSAKRNRRPERGLK